MSGCRASHAYAYLMRVTQVPLHQQGQQLAAHLLLSQPVQLLCHLRRMTFGYPYHSWLCDNHLWLL